MTASEPRLPDDFSDVEEIPRHSGRLRVALEISIALLVLAGIYYLFKPQPEIELPPLQTQEIDPIIRAQIDAARQPATEASATSDSEESQTSDPPSAGGDMAATAPATTEQALPDGDEARKIIANLRHGSQSLEPAEMVRQATAFQQAGRLTDAYLLLFYAARQGDGEAAFAFATLHDPNHFLSGNSLLEAPDSLQAYKWYSLAATHKVPQAEQRLQALRGALEKQAAGGDTAARRLLLNWQ
jgi:TPR repeat protein